MSKLEQDWHLWWLVSVHLTRTRVSQEEGVPVEKLFPSDWLVGRICGIHLIANFSRRTQSTVEGTMPRQVGLG